MEALQKESKEVLQSQLDVLVQDWKDEYNTRDNPEKIDFEPQRKLEKFLKENWDTKKYQLDLVLSKEAWEDDFTTRGMSVIPDDNRHVSEGRLAIIAVDMLNQRGMQTSGDEDMVTIEFYEKIVEPKKAILMVYVQPGDKNALRLIPYDVHSLRFEEKSTGQMEFLKEEVPYKRGKTQDYGYRIHSLQSLATAWQEADRLEQNLVVVLNNGRKLLIERSQMGVTEPQVRFVDDEEGKEGKMSVFEFFHLEPKVYGGDQDEVVE